MYNKHDNIKQVCTNSIMLTMKTRYIRGDEGEAHHIQSGLILRLHIVFDSRYAHNELLESCRFLMSNFSILEHFAAHLEFFRFFALSLFTIKSCNSIKYFLFSLRSKFTENNRPFLLF